MIPSLVRLDQIARRVQSLGARGEALEVEAIGRHRLGVEAVLAKERGEPAEDALFVRPRPGCGEVATERIGAAGTREAMHEVLLGLGAKIEARALERSRLVEIEQMREGERRLLELILPELGPSELVPRDPNERRRRATARPLEEGRGARIVALVEGEVAQVHLRFLHERGAGEPRKEGLEGGHGGRIAELALQASDLKEHEVAVRVVEVALPHRLEERERRGRIVARGIDLAFGDLRLREAKARIASRRRIGIGVEEVIERGHRLGAAFRRRRASAPLVEARR